MKEIKNYEHHGKNVAVFAENKGKHRENCLCFSCEKFNPEGDEKCKIADATYENCKEHNIVTPVWECPEFSQSIRPNFNKPIILCFVGESASGKSRAAKYVNDVFGIKLIKSYTEREMRPEEKDGGHLDHKFLTKEEFDQIDPVDMIAYTEWNGNRYCCTKQHVNPINVYIIDEYGLKLLRKNFSDEYNIISLRFTCEEETRLKRAGKGGKKRLERDKGKFTMSHKYDFDFVINTDVGPKLSKTRVDATILQVLGNCTNAQLDLFDLEKEY